MDKRETEFAADFVSANNGHVAAPPFNFPLAISAIAVRTDSPVPIYEQICRAVRTAIGTGDLPPGTPLPTSRELARALGTGRNTICTAYARLVAEGYLISNTRRGTHVAKPVGTSFLIQDNFSAGESPREKPSGSGAEIEISYRAKQMLKSPLFPTSVSKPFGLNAPDYSLCPRNPLGRLLAAEFCLSPNGDVRQGHRRFQVALSAYLRRMRGVYCEPEQVIPITGIESALDLTARVMIDPGHVVQIEDPTSDVVRQAFLTAGARLVELPSDSKGADPSRASGPPPRLMFVSPSAGFPLGRQMPELRRFAVLDAARRAGAIVFEADNCWELSYTGSRLRAIQGYDRDGCVIYFGSLTETLGPHIRIGYLVVPAALADSFTDMAQRVSYGPDAFVLAALATFIEENQYAKHIKTIRAVYAHRLRTMAEACRSYIGSATVLEPVGGFHLTLMFPDGTDEEGLCRAAAEHGLLVTPLSRFYLRQNQKPGVVLGFGAVADRLIEPTIRRLASVIEDFRFRGELATALHS
jgi:GntR family transcriptional regulator/MocR family aminotransferase